jgi:stringent starvation protein B
MNDNKKKLAVAQAILLRGSVFVHIDPSATEELHVPPHLYKASQITLQFGFNMPIPIPDLYLGDTGISGTLSFKGTPFECFVPWEAVFALIGEDSKGEVFDIALVKELARQLDAEEAPPAAPRKPAAVIDLAAYRARKAK